MKRKLYKIIISVFLMQIGFIFGAFAQIDSLRIKLDHVFTHIDKSQVPTGFLEEYGAQFVNLNRFNGVLTDSNEVNALGWQYIYATVYSSRIYGANTLPTPEANYTTFDNEAKANQSSNPVSMLALGYSSLKPDAVTNNLFTITNDQLYDVPGRAQSPYQQNIAFAAAPFYDTDADGELQLLFKQNLFINNTGKTVSNIKVDFGNGTGFVTASWDNALAGTYLDTGLKKLTIQLTFTDATILKCYSSVRILKASAGSRMMSYQPSEVTIPFDPTANNHSGGDVTVQYSVNNTTPSGNRQFQKPFIVVEGFDMHDAAPLLMERGYDYESFRREITNVAFSSSGVYNTFNYNLDNIGGYDLIFLNYRDGTDDILRNALLLQEVIEWVNANKATGADQNVVMGISMGGLVGRYCLAKMTKDGVPTQTRLLITHDSPHRGANIPLGAQYAINDFQNMNLLGRKMTQWIPQLKQVVELQKKEATIQQLIVRYNPQTFTVEDNTFLVPGGPYRQMVTFNGGDNQPTYEFVATSQGSQCAEPVMAPYSTLAKTSGEVGYSIIMGSYGSGYSGEIEINALPNQSVPKVIARLIIKAKHKIFWIPINSTIVNYQRYSPANILGYDGAPGGIQSLTRFGDVDEMPAVWNHSSHLNLMFYEWFYGFSGVQFSPVFTFVPTASALDQELNTTNLFSPHEGISYLPPSNNTLLQSYIAQEPMVIAASNISNVLHTRFTSRNSRWVFDKMEANTYQSDCEDYCDPAPFSIIGNSNFCITSGSYSIPNLPPGASVVWTATPSGIVSINTPNAQQTTLTKIINGKVELKATISGGCNTTAVKADIVAGLPTDFGMDVGAGNFANLEDCGSGSDFKVLFNSSDNNLYSGYLYVTASNATGINWMEISNSGTPYWSWNTTNGEHTLYVSQKAANQYLSLQFEATNACGSVSQIYSFSTGSCPVARAASVGETKYQLSPNPAQNTVTISINRDWEDKTLSITQIRIYDGAAKLKKQMQYAKGARQAQVNISDLRPGYYYVEISDGRTSERKPLVVQK